MGEMETNNIPEPTTELSKSIKAIGQDTVHKICSGQVVLSLAIAVKELVENSMDAGASIIEIKLKEHGLESITVSDNGCGVDELNLEAMSAKYHTSKIREFSDLQDVESFGFRGEALSSLSALSDMVILTRHKKSEYGIKIELDNEGKIKQKTSSAREIGTTVILSNLFSTLPVRKRDFTKNIKKEFTKMCQILQAYCLIAKGVRIICTNQNAKGSRNTFLSTFGSQSIIDNVTAIFGSKQAADLIPIKSIFDEGKEITKEMLCDVEDPNSSVDFSSDDIEKLQLTKFKIEGWISSCKHGCGRSSRDRQYYFINSRPCEPKNIARIVNEVYHRYNVHQYPFIYLNLIIERSNIDVNLTPDKRQLLINNEKILIHILRRCLVKTFVDIPSTFKIQNSNVERIMKKENNLEEVESDDEVKLKPNSQKFVEIFSQWKNTGNTDEACKPIKTNKRKYNDEIRERTLKMKKIQSFLTKNTLSTDNKEEVFVTYNSDEETEIDEKEKSQHYQSLESKEFDELINDTKKGNSSNILKSKTKDYDDNVEYQINCKVQTTREDPELIIEKIEPTQTDSIETDYNPNSSEDSCESSVELIVEPANDENKSFLNLENPEKINITIDEIRNLVICEEKFEQKNTKKCKLDRLKFKTEINPNQNKNAEQELEREITKDMFSKMEIIGQFNLGFIIVRLDNDLFIVDQHATDEKYNFEDLQKTVVLQNQKLVIPQSLELTAINEMILIDNLKIFEANGFKFSIDEEAPITKKVKLVAKPFSKNWQFGKEDIDELIFMLEDAPPDTMCRPSRVRAMFASRSCRKSVMIGKALNMPTMRKLINHMGEIEQPWNCPHGRPTMRHLVNLEMLADDKN